LPRDSDRLLERVKEKRPSEWVRAPGDRSDRGRVEAEVLDPLRELGLDGRDRLADVADLELGKLLPVGLDGIGKGMQKPRALGRRRPSPVPVKSSSCRLDRAVDVSFTRNRNAGERLPGRGLAQLAGLAGHRLGAFTVDEQPVLALGRYSHGPEPSEWRERVVRLNRPQP